MDQNDDPRELERKFEQPSRIASNLTDQTTIERLRGWVEQLRQGLRQRSATHRTHEEINARARELWEQNGCPNQRRPVTIKACRFTLGGLLFDRNCHPTAWYGGV
jgi:Protein of unknown function (DUF2934)